MAKASKEEVQEVHLQTQRTGRVAMLGSLDSETKELWLVFHGYRMLATNFVRKFRPLLDEDTCILAPEGLSRFYVDGFSGRVGASWMTKEDRLAEIEDQIVWLDRIWDLVMEKTDASKCKVHLLGFSQGVATMWRWLARRELIPATIAFYAGKIPDEYSQKMDDRLSRSRLFFLYGSRDEFINEQLAAYLKGVMLAHLPDLEILTFDGKHDIYPEPLERLKAMMEN